MVDPMSALPIPITLVRWQSRDANLMLERFVHGGRYSGRRPPRGLDPEYVSYWIRENVKADCAPGAMMRVTDLLRFYERKDILDHVSRFLTRNEADERSFRRSLYVLQAIGEMGTAEQTGFAVRYFNEYLVPQPFAMEFFTLLLDTAEALSIAVDPTVVGRRLQTALASAKDQEFRRYSDYNRNDLPVAIRTIEARRRLSMANPTQRVGELLQIYMGISDLSTLNMHIWAGRTLRDYAMQGGQSAINSSFGQIFDNAMKMEAPKPRKDFLLHRSGQAIIYLQGKLTFPQEAAYDAIEQGSENFLWDDI